MNTNIVPRRPGSSRPAPEATEPIVELKKGAVALAIARIIVVVAALIPPIVVGYIVYDSLTAERVTVATQEQTPEQKREKLQQTCFNAYGRTCHDETEAVWAGFRSGFNKAMRE